MEIPDEYHVVMSEALEYMADSAAIAEIIDNEKSGRKSDALYEWVLSIGIFWKQNFDIPFTYDYDSSIETKSVSERHISIALDVLMQLIAPVDEKVAIEHMAYVLQNVISDLNKMEVSMQ